MKRLLFFLPLILCLSLSAQERKALALGGSLRLSANYYRINGADLTQNPFNWVISGNPTLAVFGMKFPVSFTYRESNLESNLRFPINRIAASPSWKWGRLHLGQRSMRFTDYTLSGRDFNGAGIELHPGIFRFAALAGNFRNVQTEVDELTDLALILPSFKRTGLGAKVGLGTAQNYFDLMFVKVEDQTEDITFQSPELDQPDILPQDNLVVGADLKLNLFKVFSLRLNGAASLNSTLNDRLAIPLDTFGLQRWLQPVSHLIEPNLSTRWGLAGDAEIGLKLKGFQLGVKYHRIDPYFRALGTFFVRNDIESYTGKMGFQLWKGRFRLNLRGGMEQNNLSGLRGTTQKRLIGSANLMLAPSKAFQLVADLSNFQRENQPSFLEVEDTLRIVNLTQLQTLTASYKRETAGPQLQLRATISRQQVEDQSEAFRIDNQLRSLNASFKFGLRWKDLGLNLSPNLLYRQMSFRGDERQTLGLGLQISQQLWEEKLTFRASANYRLTSSQLQNDNRALNLRASLRAQVGEPHQFSLNLTHLNRVYEQVGRPNRSTLRANLSYTFHF